MRPQLQPKARYRQCPKNPPLHRLVLHALLLPRMIRLPKRRGRSSGILPSHELCEANLQRQTITQDMFQVRQHHRSYTNPKPLKVPGPEAI